MLKKYKLIAIFIRSITKLALQVLIFLEAVSMKNIEHFF